MGDPVSGGFVISREELERTFGTGFTLDVAFESMTRLLQACGYPTWAEVAKTRAENARLRAQFKVEREGNAEAIQDAIAEADSAAQRELASFRKQAKLDAAKVADRILQLELTERQLMQDSQRATAAQAVAVARVDGMMKALVDNVAVSDAARYAVAILTIRDRAQALMDANPPPHHRATATDNVMKLLGFLRGTVAELNAVLKKSEPAG